MSLSKEEENELIQSFVRSIGDDVAVPVAAMHALIQSIKRSKAGTWMQLEQELRNAIKCLKSQSRSEHLRGRTTISLGSGCELFMKYVTRAFSIDDMEFNTCKEELLKRGKRFAGMSFSSRTYIADVGHSFVQDSCTVLIHGNSRVVLALLLKAAESKQFNIIITEGRPNDDGYILAKTFIDAGIPTKVILDCAVGSVMDQVDLCLVGAEGVMENGGIINKLGTYQIAIVAKALKKPFYVAVESYKFARMYPLSQKDLNDLYLNDGIDISNNVSEASSLLVDKTSIDFTPAEFITLLFTDLGALTPAAVSDELIRLFE